MAIVESPTFAGLLDSLRQTGARVIGVPVDENGFDVGQLERLLARHEVKLVALQTACQNPTGRDLSEERRVRLAELAIERNFFILEDRVYADTSFGHEPTRPLRELAPAHVIYINSLSKVVGGGLRAGWVAARGPVRERIAMLKLESDFFTAALIQHIAARWLATGAYDRHVEHTQPYYRERRDALLAALERHMPGEYQADRPEGGHHIWVTLNAPARRARPLPRGRAPRRGLHAGRRDHGRAPHADFVPAVVLAARPGRAGRGRQAAGARHPRGAPPGAPHAWPRRCPSRRCRPSPRARRACAARRARSGRGTAGGRRRGASSAPRRTALRPSSVISANRPRASLAQRSRRSRPWRSSRSTRRVSPLRLSSTESASSDMRMRPSSESFRNSSTS